MEGTAWIKRGDPRDDAEWRVWMFGAVSEIDRMERRSAKQRQAIKHMRDASEARYRAGTPRRAHLTGRDLVAFGFGGATALCAVFWALVAIGG